MVNDSLSGFILDSAVTSPLLVSGSMCVYMFQGSIQGRDEFQEGLARGVNSLMGNTVGEWPVISHDILHFKTEIQSKNLTFSVQNKHFSLI